MRVTLQYGRRFGEVVDLPPTEARLMLADGRAKPVVEDGPPAPDPEAIVQRDPVPEHRDPRPGMSRTNPRPARGRR